MKRVDEIVILSTSSSISEYFPLRRSNTSRMYIKDVKGLGPTKNNVFISPSQARGGTFDGMRREDRFLVFTIGFEPKDIDGWRLEDIRSDLYRLTSNTESPVQVWLRNNDEVFALTNGWVSDFQCELFTKEPLAQITLECPEPYWVASSGPVVLGPGEGLTNGVSPAEFTNEGDVQTGLELSFELTADCEGLHILSGSTGSLSILDEPFLSGDIITLISNPNEKVFFVTRGSEEISLLAKIYSNKNRWPEVSPSDNFIYLMDGALADLTAFNWVYIKYTPEYMGV